MGCEHITLGCQEEVAVRGPGKEAISFESQNLKMVGDEGFEPPTYCV